MVAARSVSGLTVITEFLPAVRLPPSQVLWFALVTVFGVRGGGGGDYRNKATSFMRMLEALNSDANTHVRHYLCNQKHRTTWSIGFQVNAVPALTLTSSLSALYLGT